MITRRVLLAGTAGSLMLAGCAVAPDGPRPTMTQTPRVDPARHQVLTRTPPADLLVPLGDAGGIAASRALFTAATAVVVVGSPAARPTPEPSSSPSVATSASPAATPAPADRTAIAAQAALALGVPLLEAGPPLQAELDRLQTRTVISYAEGLDVKVREIIPGPDSPAALRIDGLPFRAKAPTVLVLADADPTPAVAATIAAAGLTVTRCTLPHPGESAATTKAVRETGGPVVGLGDSFGPPDSFAAAVEATRTAPELPGGGIVPFPRHRMIALYGHPSTPALGMMGEQPPAQAAIRLKKLVAEYAAAWPNETVMGAFEIIATVASAAAGDDGNYSFETPAEVLQPWIDAAEANGFYVVLDLQPGRTDFLTQAKRYADLLQRPHVGLALDPEWRLKPDGKHLVEIGQVGIDEVNAVGAWLADFVRDHKLPPKVLTLHQFQTRMIVGRERLDLSRPEVQWLVHVDGQGPQGAKQGTWAALKKDLPEGVFLGWKNFEDEDLPMLTPQQTVAQVRPAPHFISYQ